MKNRTLDTFLIAALLVCSACAKASNAPQLAHPATKTQTALLAGGFVKSPMIDRFSDQAAHLFQRSSNPGLPAPNAPINFDQGPFITQGFAPNGDYVSYYNFDVMSTTPAPIYVFFAEGVSSPIAGQNNLVDVIPGDKGYNDFWNVVKVTVPKTYQANQIKSVSDLLAAGYKIEKTSILVNCPIVPVGSTASIRYAGSTDTGLHLGWYRGQVVNYFNFSEAKLTLSSSGEVPLSPIYVMFNKNPNPQDAGSGPASGFVVDSSTGRTHNVIETVPDQKSYSPLWYVEVLDNGAFTMIHDAASAEAANTLVDGAATVNCPCRRKKHASLIR